ncbi:carbonic anhydrase [Coprinopsis cinerea okayama7|uniref:Carbonic anhydrase n=1 Tax=Coprinopsis cinerea (strain Okayama-7 / 130 / ATCC MYA-4618 / FGSC 9003) TaxID=240176 RepID=A8NBU7_COPC7|nr:carbonic anhydrase [Coprinopsis cinerea okayama7\|eukprot:XP_001832295.1 carbonic anhydrase [Coprinopsis cinerea okayama7\
MVSFRSALFALATVSFAFGHPVRESRDLKIIGTTFSALVKRQDAPGSELQLLVDGNKVFKESDPELLKKLADEGQAPPFMFLGCADSRVSEGTVFNAKPGMLFTQRNIANQFHATDVNSESVLAYAVSVLGVKHVIVMGHYGCGGVAAAIASRPKGNVDAALSAVYNWIEPIRELFASSSRPEIVELRERIKDLPVVEEPENNEPGFRALVEENVKATVGRIAQDNVIVNHYALLAAADESGATNERRAEGGPAGDVFIHGWVYDIENGEIRDLGVSVGPPGKAIPPVPFASVVNAAEKTTAAHETPQKRCEEMCKSRRSFLPTSH